IDGDTIDIGRAPEVAGDAEAPRAAHVPAPTPLGLRGRSVGGRGRAIPPELLALGVVESPISDNGAEEEAPKRGGRKKAKAADGAPKKPRKPRAKKAAKSEE